MQMGDLGSYRFIQKDGVGIGAVMPKMAEMPISCWSYYIGVDDIDRAVRAIEAGGGKVINGPMEIPGGEFALDGIDPEGADFGLVGQRNSQTTVARSEDTESTRIYSSHSCAPS